MNALALKLIGALAAALMLVVLVADRNHWKGKAKQYNAEAVGLYQETRAASGNFKLERKDTRQQIRALGESNARLKASLAHQNEAVARLGAETTRQQRIAAEALERATGRAKAAASQSDRLKASALQEARKSAPCAPSDELQRSWR